jgi:hypothetical protein
MITQNIYGGLFRYLDSTRISVIPLSTKLASSDSFSIFQLDKVLKIKATLPENRVPVIISRKRCYAKKFPILPETLP